MPLRSAFAELPAVLQELDKSGTPVELLFLDAADEILIRATRDRAAPSAP
jgi:RNase adaptor protein for sRNA GlmZ degradation